jgi:hypothetical protein
MDILGTGCLTLALGLVGGLAATDACARDTAAHDAAAHDTAAHDTATHETAAHEAAPAHRNSKHARPHRPARALPAPTPDAQASLLPAIAQVPPAPDAVTVVASSSDGAASEGNSSSRTGTSKPESQVDLDSTDDVNLDELCEKQCGTVQEINLLPEAIFEKAEALPVLGMFVLPVTKGVTLDPGQGLPAITFAVKPTKITRGNGLVAIARF